MKDPVAVTEQKAIPEVAAAAYQPARVRLYGIGVTTITDGVFGHGGAARFHVTIGANPPGQWEVAAIYGYSHEGHCYSLPKPCLLVVPRPAVAADGCGYTGQPVPYSMWIMDKLDRSMMMSVEQGFIEELILQQNIGGPKTPAAYGTRVQLAHRGGKLTDN
ncbi:MAG: hypothetical protein ACREEE_04315 [Dongiaceae bacterium]